jgi:hypothetical protein
LLTLANSCEDFVVRAHEQERRGEQVVDGHVQFSEQSGHGTLRIVKLVSIIDEHTRECLTSLVERSVTADALIDELDRLALTRGYPAVLRCDNGPELACEAMADWAGEHVASFSLGPRALCCGAGTSGAGPGWQRSRRRSCLPSTSMICAIQAIPSPKGAELHQMHRSVVGVGKAWQGLRRWRLSLISGLGSRTRRVFRGFRSPVAPDDRMWHPDR